MRATALPLLISIVLLCSPAAEAQESSYSLFAGDSDGRAYLGVRSEEDTDSDEGGARIVEVVDESPAARAGLEEGDVIVRFGDHPVRGPASLTLRIREREPGEQVEVKLRRGDKKLSLDVELGRRTSPFFFRVEQGDREIGIIEPRIRADVGKALEAVPFIRMNDQGFDVSTTLGVIGDLFGRQRLGVQLVETTPELRAHLGGSKSAGVLVSKVLTGDPAATAGIQVGDLILSVDGKEVADVAALRGALGEVEEARCTIELVRQGERRTVEVRFPEPDEDVPTGPRA